MNIYLKFLLILILINTFCCIYIFVTKLQIVIKENNLKHVILEEELSTFHSYSQFFEDLILFIILYDIEKGFYIDVGGFEPIRGSITNSFYLRGWHGINIEPQIKKIELFNQMRPNDINLQLAIGNKQGNVLFYVNEAVSTYNKNYVSNHKNIINVTLDTMSNICRKYVPKGTEIDFCKIDVEGSEKDVLLGYDFFNYRAKMFCIESTIPSTNIPNYKLWEDILIKNDYVFIFEYGINRYYVDKHYPQYIKRSENIKDYLDNFKAGIYKNKTNFN